jgi:hypothetical protein
MPGCNKLWSVEAAEATGPVPRDAGEQSTGATPRPRAGEKDGRKTWSMMSLEAAGGKGPIDRLGESTGFLLALMGNDGRSSGCENRGRDAAADRQWNAQRRWWIMGPTHGRKAT